MVKPNGDSSRAIDSLRNQHLISSASSQVHADADSSVRRPKLLLLAWNFPPTHAIASVRTWNLAKYLARLGWQVTVMTPQPTFWRDLENPARAEAHLTAEGIQRILTDHHWRFLLPSQLTGWNNGLGWIFGGFCRRIVDSVGIDRAVGWIKPAERACKDLGPNDVDLILASGPPFTPFLMAERLSKRLVRPYVLDYRDPWTEPGSVQVHPALIARLEARLLKGAAAVTTVSRSWARDLDSRYKLGAKVHVITNGYDPEDLAEVQAHDFGHFAIVYAGNFYPPTRVITPVLEALQLLKAKDGSSDYYFHYYGQYADHVSEEAVRLGVIDRVKLHGRVSRSQALSAVRGADIGVVISSVFEEASGRATGWVPAKVFEMIGLRTPILLIAPPGTDIESIAKTAGLSRRFSGGDVAGIASFLEQLMAGGTSRNEQGSSNSFAWANVAGAFDIILRKQLLRSQVAGESS